MKVLALVFLILGYTFLCIAVDEEEWYPAHPVIDDDDSTLLDNAVIYDPECDESVHQLRIDLLDEQFIMGPDVSSEWYYSQGLSWETNRHYHDTHQYHHTALDDKRWHESYYVPDEDGDSCDFEAVMAAINDCFPTKHQEESNDVDWEIYASEDCIRLRTTSQAIWTYKQHKNR